MDVQPIATKEGSDAKLGEGVTRVIDGAIVMVTGIDEDGVQVGEFGSSEGILEENIMWGRPGAPDKGEIFNQNSSNYKKRNRNGKTRSISCSQSNRFYNSRN